MVDIIGPASAPNSVLVRPSDDRVFGTIDTWFKDCTSLDADDGTDIAAAWLNGITAELRSLWRANGKLTDNLTSVVLENGVDDDGVTKAVQHLIQRSQQNWAIDTGTANAMVVTLAPALAEYKAGVIIRAKVAFKNTGPATLNANGLGNKNIIRSDGINALQPGDLVPGMAAEFIFDGTNFQLMTRLPRVKLTGNLTLYISTAGSDVTGDGSIAKPWRTRQFAWYAAQAIYDLAYSFTLTFQMADGTYTDSFVASGTFVGATSPASIIFQGNTTTPGNCTINVATGAAWTAQNMAQYRIQGFTVIAAQYGVLATIYGWVSIGGSIVFGACPQGHLVSNVAGTIEIDGSYTVTGNAANHLLATTGSYIFYAVACGVTLTGTPSFSNAFAAALGASNISAPSSLVTFAGAGTGQRYFAASNGVLNTNGGGANFFPGNSAGGTASGGQYI